MSHILFLTDLMKIMVKIKNITLLTGTVIFLLACSYILFLIEPETFSTFFLAFWYVMTTVTTVGYGDLVPETVTGKVFALFLYLFGIGLIGIVIGKIVEGFGVYQKMKEAGKLSFRGKGHFVIIGWSHKAKKTIDELLLAKEDGQIVLIDFLENCPESRGQIHYIQGDATEREIIEKANMKEASAVLIFAPENINDPVAIDGRSLLIASMIESYASSISKNIYTIVEIAKEKHITNFNHVNVDEFVLSNEAFSDLMAKSALHKGSSRLFMHLLSRKYGDNVWEINKKASWTCYNDAYEALKKMGANLIADKQDFGIIRKLSQPIPNNARLYVICDEKTYRQIEATD